MGVCVYIQYMHVMLHVLFVSLISCPSFFFLYIYNNVTFLHYFVVKVNMKSKLVPALKWLYFWNTYFS